MRIGVYSVLIAGLSMSMVLAIRAGEIDQAVSAIKGVKREGLGNEAAAKHWKDLVKAGPTAIPTMLAAFPGADATVVNWFRSAIDAIAESETKAGRKLDAAMLEQFVKEAKNDPRARLLAFELLERVEPDARKRLLPTMENDPGAGLRREAIEFALKHVDILADNSNKRIQARLGKLFDSARDVDQVESIAKKLKAVGGEEANVIEHLGLITRWEIAGPFSNAGLKGFAAPLPKVDSWKEFATGEKRGMVDLYQALEKAKGVKNNKKDAVYALCRTAIDSPSEREAEIRVASENAVKIFLNGKEVFGREEYHHGHKLDQHIARVALRNGHNVILLKILQDDLTYEWTVDWQFQCRVCDEIGGAIPMKVLTAPNAVPVAPKPKPKEEKK
jgi:hypothetical protein